MMGGFHLKKKKGIGSTQYPMTKPQSTQQVLFISIHQDSNYPAHTGYAAENGAGKGEGYNINISLPPGCGHGAYYAAFDRVVVPALQVFVCILGGNILGVRLTHTPI